MQLTDEQIEIVNSQGDLKINAVAGSGKTTTVIEYAKCRPDVPILYLAFNRSVRQEAERKFRQLGLTHVQVETAHSLAHRHVVRKSTYSLRTGYSSFELTQLLDLKPHRRDKLAPFILANHINKFAAYFCNSARAKVSDLSYLDIVVEDKAREFVAKHYDEILQRTRTLLAKMEHGEIDITHDFYLKKFQLLQPRLPFAIILFDEGQDASPAMLDVFLKQSATHIIVGDRHQQIYGWRFAVNSLDTVDFPQKSLTCSFRFDQEIAVLAEKILLWKRHFAETNSSMIRGIGGVTSCSRYATLARSNTLLLTRAIQLLFERREIKNHYFEGNFGSYLYADGGNSLYDVLNLYLDHPEYIKDPLIKTMTSFNQLEDYAAKTEDNTLKLIIDLIKQYGSELPALLKKLKEAQVPDDRREQADMIFSTVHRSKGLEYDHVTVMSDFISESDIIRAVEVQAKKPINKSALAEEVNLLYVAVTRTANRLKLPSQYAPDSHVTLYNPDDEQRQSMRRDFKDDPFGRRGESFFQNSRKWTAEEEKELIQIYRSNKNIELISRYLHRSPSAIVIRLEKLGAL
ncbi:MAG: ATP-dependent helicase [Calditrichaeota bacterium]|nr:MAG: ATP-dependent helicase [Calditrichota bacterium]